MSKDSVRVSGIGLGTIEVKLEGTGGLSVAEVLDAAGVSVVGKSISLNGRRLSDGETGTARVNGGEDVKVLKKSQGGRS